MDVNGSKALWNHFYLSVSTAQAKYLDLIYEITYPDY